MTFPSLSSPLRWWPRVLSRFTRSAPPRGVRTLSDAESLGD
ncbi:hypothetical protein [Deinococcus sp. KSM4-11]|nr:hypothetical protein [Deinococcus sp. KSM4-11]